MNVRILFLKAGIWFRIHAVLGLLKTLAKIALLLSGVVLLILLLFKMPSRFIPIARFTAYLGFILAGIKPLLRFISEIRSKTVQSRIRSFLLREYPGSEKIYLLLEFGKKEAPSELEEYAIHALQQEVQQLPVSDNLSTLRKKLSISRSFWIFCIYVTVLTGMHIFSHDLRFFWTGSNGKYNRLKNILVNYTENKTFVEGDTVIFKVKSQLPVKRIEVQINEQNSNDKKFRLPLFPQDSLFISDPFVLKKSITYQFSATPYPAIPEESILSRSYFINVLPVPAIQFLELIIHYPPYTSVLPDTVNSDSPLLLIPEGGKLELYGYMDHPPEDLRLIFNNNKGEIPLSLQGNYFKGVIQPNGNDRFHFSYRVQGTSREFIYPVEFQIQLLADKNPSVLLLSPKGEVTLKKDMKTVFELLVEDDYGMDSLFLNISKIRDKSKLEEWKIDFSNYLPSHEKMARLELPFLFRNTFLLPGEYLQVYLSVRDNFPWRKQTANSDTVYFTLESVNQLVESTRQLLDSIAVSENQLLQSVDEQTQLIQRMKKDLLRTEKLDQKSIESAKEILAQLEKMEERLKQTKEQLRRARGKMQDSPVLSEETLKKYFELQEMLEQIAGEELKKIRENLQKLLNDKTFQDQKNTMQLSEETIKDLQEQIEQFYELLQEANLEKKLDELLYLANHLLEENQQLLDRTKGDSLRMNDKSRLKLLEEDHELFTKEIKEASRLFSSRDSITSHHLDRLHQEVKNSGLDSNYRSLSNQFSMVDKQEIAGKLNQNMTRYRQFQAKLNRIRNDFLQGRKEKLMTLMKEVIGELLWISNEQEELTERYTAMEIFSKEVPEIAIYQNHLKTLLTKQEQQLVSIARRTFLFNPMIIRLLRNAEQQMEGILNDLQNRFTQNVKKDAPSVVGNINLAVYFLLASQKQISSSSSTTGIEEFLQQMQQLAMQQQGLNEQTMELFRQSGGQLTPAQLGRLQRIREEQEAIRRSMEYLEGGGKASEQMENQLKGIKEEMDQLIQELKRNRLTQPVLERQMRIFNRMLSTTHSLQEKELSEQREAEKAKEYEAIVPAELGKDIYHQNEILEMIRYIKKLNIDNRIKNMLIEYYEKLLYEK